MSAAVNLDALVRAGRPPWLPSPDARDLDPWEKYDFPSCGTYWLGDRLVVFTLITTAGRRSLWAYAPVQAGQERAVEEASFDTESDFEAFLAASFADREVIFAAAEDFRIAWKSDGIWLPPAPGALLAAATRWYVQRAIALGLIPEGAALPAASAADASESEESQQKLLREAQRVLASAGRP